MSTGDLMNDPNNPMSNNNLSALSDQLRMNANQVKPVVPPSEPGPSRTFTIEPPDPTMVIEANAYYSTLGHAMALSNPTDTSTKSYLKQLDALIPLSYVAAYQANKKFLEADEPYQAAKDERIKAQKALDDAKKAIAEKEAKMEKLFESMAEPESKMETLFSADVSVFKQELELWRAAAPENKEEAKAKLIDKMNESDPELQALKAQEAAAETALQQAKDDEKKAQAARTQALAESEALSKYHELLVTLRAQTNNHNAYVAAVFEQKIEAIKKEYLTANGNVIQPNDQVFFNQLDAMKKMHTKEWNSVYGVQLFGERKSPCEPGSNSMELINGKDFKKKGQVRITDDGGVVTGSFDYNVNILLGAKEWGVSRKQVLANFNQQVSDFVTIALNDYPSKGTQGDPIVISYVPPDKKPELGLALLLEYKMRAVEMGKPLYVKHNGKIVEISPEKGFASKEEADMFITQGQQKLFRRSLDGTYKPDHANRNAAFIICNAKVDSPEAMQKALLGVLEKKLDQKPDAQLSQSRDLLIQAKMQKIDSEPLAHQRPSK